MSAKSPQELEAQFSIEMQASSKSPNWDERLRRGYCLISDSDVAEILHGHEDTVRFGGSEVLFPVLPRFLPWRKETLTGIIEEESNLGYMNPVIANITLYRKPFLLRVAERAVGNVPNAQYFLDRNYPTGEQQVVDTVNAYKAQAIERLRDVPQTGDAFTASYQAILGQCEEALERWDIA